MKQSHLALAERHTAQGTIISVHIAQAEAELALVSDRLVALFAACKR